MSLDAATYSFEFGDRANGRAARMRPNPLPEIDASEADRFLRRLDPNADTWCFRTLREGSAGRNYTGTLEQAGTNLMHDNLNGRGVFVVVNKGGHKAAEITAVRALFVDFDPPKTKALPEAFDVAPTMIVESSPGHHHAYWLVDGLAIDEFEKLQSALARRHGSDPAVKDCSRVMRLAGFLHLKGAPFRARIIRDDGEAPIDAQRVRDWLAPYLSATGDERARTHSTNADGEAVVDEGRHDEMIRLAASLVHWAIEHGLARDSVVDMLYAERARGRWTREMPDAEISRAVDGAYDKYARGVWGAPVPEPLLGAATDRDNGTHLREVSLADYTRGREGPEFAIEPILPRATTTLLGGHGGVLKSTVALSMLASWACGKEYVGFRPERPLRCVLIPLEDPAAVVLDRLRKVTTSLDLDPWSVVENLRVLDGSDTAGALAVERNEAGVRMLDFTPLMAEVEAAALSCDVLVIDGASDAFDGDENSRRQVRAFVRRLNQTAKRANVACVVVVHVDKNAARNGANGQTYSGSTAWHNSVRSRLALGEDRDDGVIVLRHEKSNYRKRAEPVALRVDETGVPVPVSGTVADAQTTADVIAAVCLMRAACRDGIPVSASTSGPATGWHKVRHLPEAEYFGEKGKHRFDAAMARAYRQRQVVKIKRKVDRKDREFWELPTATAALAQFGSEDASIEPGEEVRRYIPHTPSHGALARAGTARANAPRSD